MSEKYFLWYAICLQGQVCYSDSKSQESKMESILIKFKDSQLHSTKSLQLCLTLCNPMDCSLPGSSVHGILQAGILQRFAISFSRGSSCLRDWNLTYSDFYSSGQLLSCIRLFETPWTAASQASMSIFNSRSLLKFMSIKSVMPSNYLILFSFLQSFPTSGSFLMSQFFTSGDQSIGVSASASVCPMNTSRPVTFYMKGNIMP